MIGFDKIIKRMDLLDSRLEGLVSATTPNKNKFLWDLSIKLYDDEVARDRWLDQKAMQMFGIIVFILTIVPPAAYWAITKYPDFFRSCTVAIFFGIFFGIGFSICIILSLLWIFKSIKIIYKDALTISDDNIEYAKNDINDVNDSYEVFVVKIRDITHERQKSNNNKAVIIDCAHQFLAVSIIIVIAAMGIFPVMFFLAL